MVEVGIVRERMVSNGGGVVNDGGEVMIGEEVVDIVGMEEELI